MKKSYKMICLLIFVIGVLYASLCVEANTARVICIGDGVELKTARVFRTEIEGYYVNNLPIRHENIRGKSEPTRTEYMRYLEWAQKISADDDVTIFFYGGHGGAENLNDVTRGYVGSLSHIDLYDALKKVKGVKIVILDACHAGGFIQANLNSIDSSKFSIITACEYSSYSPFEIKASDLKKGNRVVSIFGQNLFKGIGFYSKNPKADLNKRDGIIDRDEIYSYMVNNYAGTYTDDRIGDYYSFPHSFGNAPFYLSKSPMSGITVKIDKTNLKLNSGSTVKLTAETDGYSKSIVWGSTNDLIATVSSDGTVKGLKPGKCNIIASANGVSAKCTITVVDTTNKVILDPTRIEIKVGQSKQIKATLGGKDIKPTWRSSNTTVATVSNGKITAKSEGTAIIKATYNKLYATCKVTVKKEDVWKVDVFSISEMSLSLDVGKSKQLYFKKNGTIVNDTTWKSSNEKIATVSSKGVVKGIKAGTATITATANGMKGTCKVTVKNETKPEEVSSYMGKEFSTVSKFPGKRSAYQLHEFWYDQNSGLRFMAPNTDYENPDNHIIYRVEIQPNGTSKYSIFGVTIGMNKTTSIEKLKKNGFTIALDNPSDATMNPGDRYIKTNTKNGYYVQVFTLNDKVTNIVYSKNMFA